MSKQFNAPPGWPEAPEGWEPSPGWQPDPEWPTAPDGWQFWQSDPAPLTPLISTMVTIVLILVGLITVFSGASIGNRLVEQQLADKAEASASASASARAQSEASEAAEEHSRNEEHQQLFERAHDGAQPIGEPERTEPLAVYSSGAEGATGKEETVYLKRPEGLENLAWVEFTFTPTTESNRGWEQIKIGTIANDKINEEDSFTNSDWFFLAWDQAQQTYTASVWVGAIQDDEQDAFSVDLPEGTAWSVSVYSPESAPLVTGSATNPASLTAANVTAFRFDPSAGTNFTLYSQATENTERSQDTWILSRVYTYPDYSPEELDRGSSASLDNEPHNGRVAAEVESVGAEVSSSLSKPTALQIASNTGVTPVTVYSGSTQWVLEPTP